MSGSEQEPGGWELQRSIAQLGQTVRDGNATLGQRFSETFTADQRRVEGVLKTMADDILEEREARKAAVAEEREARAAAVAALEKQLARLTAILRWVAASIVIPIALFLANLYVSRGGA